MLSLAGNSCLLVYFKRELTPKLRQHCMKIWTTLSSHFIKMCCWNSSPLFSSLIAVCFGSDFLVNHHESDCMTNELLQGKCANWHYYTWSQPSFYQKLKITPWTKKTTVKKKQQWISLSPLLSALLNHPWDLSSRGQKDPRPAIFKCYRHHPVIHDQCIWTPQ